MAPAGRPQSRASTGVSGVPLRLTNLDKIYWPEENLTKGDLIDYYSAVSPYILNHLKDRPDLLEEIRIKSYCKSSGASGIHIYVPLLDSCGCGYDISRSFAAALCSIVHSQKPTETTLERSPGLRRGRVYLDYLQNKRGQTLAAPYCVRPRPKAPISTPVTWDEVKNGFYPTDFTLTNMTDRLKRRGDLWHDILDNGADIGSVLPRLPKIRGV